jgi:hypothetical protein
MLSLLEIPFLQTSVVSFHSCAFWFMGNVTEKCCTFMPTSYIKLGSDFVNFLKNGLQFKNWCLIEIFQVYNMCMRHILAGSLTKCNEKLLF